MKQARKILTLALCAILLVSATVAGTLAYLTSTDTVTNTFSVGQVKIHLDEAKVDANGKAITGKDAARIKANSYKLLPGHTYDKDPMVTVEAGSENAYIRMLVTVTKAKELDAIFAPTGANMTSIFTGYDSSTWILNGTTDDAAANTRTYEFRYKTTVAAPDKAVALDALFDQIVVPGDITNDQLATLKADPDVEGDKDMQIIVVAHAIQADGFTDANKAWEAFAK